MRHGQQLTELSGDVTAQFNLEVTLQGLTLLVFKSIFTIISSGKYDCITFHSNEILYANSQHICLQC